MTHAPFARGVTHLAYVGDVEPTAASSMSTLEKAIGVLALYEVVTGKSPLGGKISKRGRLLAAGIGTFIAYRALRAR